MIRTLLGAALVAIAIPAAGQSTPAANYTDMWWNAAESGWGVSFAQHAGTHQVFAVWYTYDPREESAGRNKPLWIVMPGGRWTTATTFAGDLYAATGPDPRGAFNPQLVTRTRVGSPKESVPPNTWTESGLTPVLGEVSK